MIFFVHFTILTIPTTHRFQPMHLSSCYWQWPLQWKFKSFTITPSPLIRLTVSRPVNGLAAKFLFVVVNLQFSNMCIQCIHLKPLFDRSFRVFSSFLSPPKLVFFLLEKLCLRMRCAFNELWTPFFSSSFTPLCIE